MKKQKITAVIWLFMLLILIIDGKGAISGAAEGIEICLYTIIPSLFPFFVITGMLTGALSGIKIPGMGWICKLCKIPRGLESVFLLGILGGYPMGARAIESSYRQNLIDKRTAQRLLGFCNNCGPSFIFGICTAFFPGLIYGWLLWGIQIICAIITGIILPGDTINLSFMPKRKFISLDQALKDSIQAMGRVCGWVVMFRVLITFQSRWFLWRLPDTLKPLIIGIQELSNGCITLHSINDLGVRFIVCSGLLTFGGLCVIMQTKTVASKLGLGLYFPGKCIQTGMTILLSCLISKLVFHSSFPFLPLLIGAAIAIVAGFVVLFRKNSSIFAKSVV